MFADSGMEAFHNIRGGRHAGNRCGGQQRLLGARDRPSEMECPNGRDPSEGNEII